MTTTEEAPGLNKGHVVLNDRPLGDDEPAVFCVLGIPGGGTTMTARLLAAAGVSMGGPKMGFNAEDPRFVRLLKEAAPDEAAFLDLVRRRSAGHRRWGFKAPLRLHPRLLSQVENVRYVTIFRDVLATGLRTVLSSGAPPLQAMAVINLQQKTLLNFIAATDRPNLVLSYEKTLTAPRGVAHALLAFTGAAATAPQLNQLRAIIEPNEPTYVAGQAGIPAALRRR